MIIEASGSAAVAPAGFLHSLCVPFLAASQNADGGWGYQPGWNSSVEPTSWALLALRAGSQQSDAGGDWLSRVQLEGGSWPAFPGQPEGCWTTALACLALHRQARSPARVQQGLDWLVSCWPAEHRLWWRMRNWFGSRHALVRQDRALVGWSWTAGAASWVEPTCYTLLLLRCVSPRSNPKAAARRIRLAEKMLLDRMCPGGGWNSGNPLVYGVAGEPRAGPTAWALLALKDRCEPSLLRSSVRWLERSYSEIRSPRSLAPAHLCLQAYGRAVPDLNAALCALYWQSEFLCNVPAVALAAIALGGGGVLTANQETA